jgi:hypothetical protein
VSDTEIKEALTKLQSLSEQRAGKVMDLISDLAELEASEDAQDLKDALESLKELEAGERAAMAGTPTPGNVQFINELDSPTVPWEKLKKELNL